MEDKKELAFVPSNVWTSDYQSFDFFSIFLERHVLNPNHLDLSFTPSEYLDQIMSCDNSEEGRGYLNLLMMLFTEYYQEKVTGEHKIRLPEEKYDLMARQFMMLCKCERLRREKKVSFIKEEFLFDPNVRTAFYVDPVSAVSFLAGDFEAHDITIKEHNA